MKETTPVFIHAWWRSGSTYVWLKLRQNPSLCCYFEPLSERIAVLEKETVGADPEPQVSIALRHPVPERNYFAEYFAFPDSPAAKYLPRFAYDRYFLSPGEVDPALQSYLGALVTTATVAGRRPILCFCRSQMRSAWIKRRFGGVHVAQIRNPFSQSVSFQVSPYFSQNMALIGIRLCALYPKAFAHIRSFAGIASGSDVNLSMGPDDALRLFLLLWIASSVQAVAHADFVLDMDLLATDAAYRDSAGQWFASIGCPADFSDCATPGAAHSKPLGRGWEAAVDEAIDAVRTHAACLVGEGCGAAAQRLSQLSAPAAGILERAVRA